ncbi:MAG: hypothetical protein HY006_03895 [Candidatus Sungbacteria bacterium]|nr:hypothetical protein [Candidatus Sungbacteria bacterium]
MKRIVLLVLVALGIFCQNVVAEVQFRSLNHAVRGGRVQVEGTGGKCASAEFRQSNETVSGRRVWKAMLPCDIADGGRVRVGVNGRPKTFHVPAGIVVHGRRVGVGMLSWGSNETAVTPSIYPLGVVDSLGDGTEDKFYVDFESGPAIKCMLVAHVSWPKGAHDYDAYMSHRNDRVQAFLARYSLPCKER